MSSTTGTDTSLLERLFTGDQSAWTVFVSQHRALIYATISRVSRRFPAAARSIEPDDIYAAFLASLVHDNMHKLRVYDPARGSLRQWLILLATNVTFDHTRKAARRPVRIELLECEDLPSTQTDALERLIEHHQCAQLLRALDEMPRRDQELVELLYVRNARPADAARAMGISVKSVYTKMHKIRTRLGSRSPIRGENPVQHSHAC